MNDFNLSLEFYFKIKILLKGRNLFITVDVIYGAIMRSNIIYDEYSIFKPQKKPILIS